MGCDFALRFPRPLFLSNRTRWAVAGATAKRYPDIRTFPIFLTAASLSAGDLRPGLELKSARVRGSVLMCLSYPRATIVGDSSLADDGS